MTRLRSVLSRDDGRIGLLVAIIVPAILFLAAVKTDSMGQIRAWQRADNVAQEAARTAGQQIDIGQAVSGGSKRVSPERAAQAAHQYLDRAGATGTVIISPDGQFVTVTAKLSYSPVVLGMFGRGPVEVSGEATAQLITG